MAIKEIDTLKIAETMIKEFDFDPSIANMETDRENYSYSLLDSLVKLYDLETLIDAALYAVSMRADNNESK